jgi:hypothetical protein
MPANPAAYKLTFYNIDSSLTSLDLNSLTTQGFYYCAGFTSSSVTLTNIPSEMNNYTKSWRLEVINQRSRVEQVLINASDNGVNEIIVMSIWKRHRFSNGNWTPWVNMRDASWINSGTFDAERIPTITPSMVESNSYYPIATTGLNAYIASDQSSYDLIDMVIAKVTKGNSAANSMITLSVVQGDNYGGIENQGIYIIQASYRGRAVLTVTKVRAGSGFEGIYYYTDDTYMYVVYRRAHYSGCITVRLIGKPAGAESVADMIAPSGVTLTEATYRELAVADGVYPSMTAGRAAVSLNNSTGSGETFFKIGTLSKDTSGVDTECSLIVSAPDNIGTQVPAVYVVTACNRFSSKVVRYSRISGDVHSNLGLAAVFGYILNSDGSIDLVLKRPSYGGRVDIQLISSVNFTVNTSQGVSGTNFVAGDRYDMITVKNASGTSGIPVGSTTKPIYVKPDGTVENCSSELPSGYGTSGQYLKSNGTGAAPSWADMPINFGTPIAGTNVLNIVT